MKKWLKVSLKVVIIILVLIIAISITYILINSNKFADILIHHTVEERLAIYENDPDMNRAQLDSLLNIPEERNALFGNNAKLQKYYLDSLLHKHNLTDYEEIWLTTKDSVKLEALYFPSKNSAAIINAHGFKSSRFGNLHLVTIAFLVRNGYGVIYTMRRAHGNSNGEIVTFGKGELNDIQVSYEYLIDRPDVNPKKIAILGWSMGGALSILYAAENEKIKAVISECAYDSFDNTLGVSVEHFTGLPAFPFADIIKFFMERKLGFSLDEYDPINSISQISPRPILIVSGGKDSTVDPSGGQNLFDTAGDPKEYWFEPEYDHNDFRTKNIEEYEKRVVGFFDKYLNVNQ